MNYLFTKTLYISSQKKLYTAYEVFSFPRIREDLDWLHLGYLSRGLLRQALLLSLFLFHLLSLSPVPSLSQLLFNLVKYNLVFSSIHTSTRLFFFIFTYPVFSRTWVHCFSCVSWSLAIGYYIFNESKYLQMSNMFSSCLPIDDTWWLIYKPRPYSLS